MSDSKRPRVVVLGGGFGGAYAAQTLHKLQKSNKFDFTVIDRRNFLTFYPLLIEAGVGAIEPRHVVVPIRKFMKRGDFRMANIVSVDLQNQEVRYRISGKDEDDTVAYDHLVLSPGSVTRIPNLPGLLQYGFELKSLPDAVLLRDRAIMLLELANTYMDPAVRRRILTVVVVGGNFTGVEFAGEYHAFMTEAVRAYDHVNPEDIKIVLVEHSKRILNAVDEKLSAWASKTLQERGIEIHVNGASVVEVGAEFAGLNDGTKIPAHTVVWAAGISPSPMLKNIPGLPLNERGYIECERDLQVKGLANVWAIGDCAAVLNAEGKLYAPTAQNASRQGTLVARNVVAKLTGQPTANFDFHVLGAFAAIGRRSAAACVFGYDLTGFMGWFMYRTVYLMKMPTIGIKIRLGLDWFGELIMPTEPVQLGVHTQHEIGD